MSSNIRVPVMPEPKGVYHELIGRNSFLVETGQYTPEQVAALNAEWLEKVGPVVEALRGTFAELNSVLHALNAEVMPHDGDEFHERLEAARAALSAITKD